MGYSRLRLGVQGRWDARGKVEGVEVFHLWNDWVKQYITVWTQAEEEKLLGSQRPFPLLVCFCIWEILFFFSFSACKSLFKHPDMSVLTSKTSTRLSFFFCFLFVFLCFYFSHNSSLPRLTAFVVKSFGQAKKYIYVDDKNIQDALRWLEQNQLPSGCFATKGSFFHSSIKVNERQFRQHSWGMAGQVLWQQRVIGSQPILESHSCKSCN